MAHFEKLIWDGGGSGQSRKDRQPCKYSVYVPDGVANRQFLLTGPAAADVADAERAVGEFNAKAVALVSTEALARILLRAESLASSRIEGLVVGARRILKAEVEQEIAGTRPDASAKEILANIEAMDHAITQISPNSKITLDLLLEINKKLLASTELNDKGGKLRVEQNWIGGNNYNPCSADFVPPKWESVQSLMEDLVEFSNQADLPAIAQAAIAHAQFETIHPFVDGNGRTGRVLIQMILRRRGLSVQVVPPVSLILATQAKEYVDGLKATRYEDDPDSATAVEGINLWVGRFAAACSRAVQDALKFESAAKVIEANWRKNLPKIRAGSSTDSLLRGLVGMPVLTVKTAMKMTNTSHQQTSAAVSALLDAGILRKLTTSLRNTSFEAPEIIAEFTELERQLASPMGDTKLSAPSRLVPSTPITE